MEAREQDRDEERDRSPDRKSTQPAHEDWRSAAGNAATQIALRSGVLPTRATAGLDWLLARAPATGLQRQVAEEEEEEPPAGAEAAARAEPGIEVPGGPVAEKLLGPEEEEEELPE
jgi:hypothetical protein